MFNREAMRIALRFFVEECGLKHRQLADLLGISRSTLTRVLLGQRPLPADAETRLVQLYTLALQPAPAMMPAAAAEESPADQELAAARQRYSQLQRQLAQCQHQQQRCQRLQAWLQQLPDQPGLLASGRPRRCYEELCWQVRRQQQAGTRQQARLQQQVAQLEQQLAAWAPVPGYQLAADGTHPAGENHQRRDEA